MSRDIPASIKARLLNKAKKTGEEFQLFLVRYACERFLYRLGASGLRDRFILKGAGLLALWMDDPYRATRDLDFLAFGSSDEASIRSVVETVCAVPCPGAGLSFDSAHLEISPIRTEEEYQGQRVVLLAHLGKARMRLQTDFGFGDVKADCFRFRLDRRRVLPPFMAFQFSVTAAAAAGALATGATRSRMNLGIAASRKVALPPIGEQRAIAAFLDQETTRIDALVAKKERLIELLQEKRTALITRAVTQGFDPDVPMKDSGVEWLGEIPAHWEMTRLGHVVKVGNGSTPSRDNPGYWVDGSYPWLTSGKINEEVIVTADEFVTPSALRECHLPRVRAGSLLVAITGEGQTRGRAALLQFESAISQHLAYVTPHGKSLSAVYLRRVFQSRYEWLRMESSGAGSTRAALTCEFLRAMQIATPPADEQGAIAASTTRQQESTPWSPKSTTPSTASRNSAPPSSPPP